MHAQSFVHSHHVLVLLLFLCYTMKWVISSDTESTIHLLYLSSKVHSHHPNMYSNHLL